MICFLTRNHFEIGVSLDGPDFIHDAQRLTKKGTISHEVVCDAIANIRKLGGNVGVVAVVTRNTLGHLDEFYDFFRDRKLSVRVNPLMERGNARDLETRPLIINSREFGEALIHLFDRWISEPSYSFAMDPFFSILRSFVGGRVYCCSFGGRCHDLFKVYPTGDLYYCGMADHKSQSIGNINVNDISIILNSQDREVYRINKAHVKEICGDCEHFDICRGGCTTSAFVSEQGAITQDCFCESYKMLFDHMKAFSNSLLAQASCII